MGRHKIWWAEIECAVCGIPFTKAYKNHKYCCDKCAKLARKAKRSPFGRYLLEEHPDRLEGWYE